MRLIFGALSLSTLVLCLGFVQAGKHNLVTLSIPEFLLIAQQLRKAAAISAAVNECNDTWTVFHDEGLKLFEHKPQFDNNTDTTKCLIDCTMRKTGLMTDNGFQDTQYVTVIKQLFRNYTDLDLKKLNLYSEDEYLDAVNKLSFGYDIIQTYEKAAKECKEMELLTDGHNCENSFRIAKCLLEKGEKRGMYLKLFPILSLKEPQIERVIYPDNKRQVTHIQCHFNPVTCF